LQWRSIPQ